MTFSNDLKIVGDQKSGETRNSYEQVVWFIPLESIYVLVEQFMMLLIKKCKGPLHNWEMLSRVDSPYYKALDILCYFRDAFQKEGYPAELRPLDIILQIQDDSCDRVEHLDGLLSGRKVGDLSWNTNVLRVLSLVDINM